jgi:hypothetical protein
MCDDCPAMKTASKFAMLILLLAFSACAKDSGGNSVWLVVKNETGRAIRDFTLDYGSASFQYAIFDSGSTQGGYARVRDRQPLSMSYTDDAGARQAPKIDAVLSPEMIGSVVTLTVRADGAVVSEVQARTGAPPRGARIEDYAPWIIGVLALLLLPPTILFIRKAKAAAADVPARAKAFFSNPVLEGAAASLGLVKKICPVRMFTMDPSHPESWHEGTLNGRMIGLLDSGRLWVGSPDQATMCAFGRANAQAPFVGRDFTERDDSPLLSDGEIARILAQMSSAVMNVGVLGDAVEAEFNWKSATPESVASDARLLSSLRDRVVSFDPPLVRAVMHGDSETVSTLIQAKTDLEAMTLGFVNAVTAAATAGRTEILKALLAAGAKALPEYGRPLHQAARAGHLEAVRALLDAGVAADHDDGWGGTALIEAAVEGREDVVAFLLSRGANPNARNKDGGTALGYARHGGHARVVEQLKAAGAK